MSSAAPILTGRLSSSSTSASVPSTASTSTSTPVSASRPRAQRCGQDDQLMMLLGVITPDAGHVEIVGHRLPHGAQRGHGAGRVRSRYLPLPERFRVEEFLACSGSSTASADPRPQVTPGPALRRPHLAQGDGQRAFVGPAHAGRDHQGHAAPAASAGARRADGSLDPDVALPRPHRARAPLRRRGHRAAGHEPQHARGRTALRACRSSCLRARSSPTARRPTSRRSFGRADLEGVFLHLASESSACIPDGATSTSERVVN